MSAVLSAQQGADIRARLERARTTAGLGLWADGEYEVIVAALGDVPALLAEVERLRADRDQFADRVDTLTAVAKGNKRHVRDLFGDLQTAQARIAELEALPPLFRATWRGGKAAPTTSYEDAWGAALAARARGERDAGVVHYGRQRIEYVPAEGGAR